MAAVRVFSIPELAEDIILRLHPRDILRLQRTCCVLRDTINETTAIQELLFLKPITQYGLYPVPRTPPRPATTPTAVTLNSSGAQWASAAAPSIERHPIENPFVRLLDQDSEAHRSPRFNRKEASWRRMLVSQPPVNCLIAKSLPTSAGDQTALDTWIMPERVAHDGRNSSSSTTTHTSSARTGVTLGDLEAIHSIRSWCLWKPFKHWDQLSGVGNGSDDRLDESFLEFELHDHETTLEAWKQFETQIRH